MTLRHTVNRIKYYKWHTFTENYIIPCSVDNIISYEIVIIFAYFLSKPNVHHLRCLDLYVNNPVVNNSFLLKIWVHKS